MSDFTDIERTLIETCLAAHGRSMYDAAAPLAIVLGIAFNDALDMLSRYAREYNRVTQESRIARICAERMEDLLEGLTTGAVTPDAILREMLADLRHYADKHELNFHVEDAAAHGVYLRDRAARD